MTDRAYELGLEIAHWWDYGTEESGEIAHAARIAAALRAYRAEALEEAAKLAENKFNGKAVAYCHAAVLIAADIRALKETKP